MNRMVRCKNSVAPPSSFAYALTSKSGCLKMTLQIGSVSLESPVILAPMSGVSDLPFRKLVRRFGVGLVVSEMIASQAMIHATRKTFRLARADADEQPFAIQLAGCEPKIMAEAARLALDLGATILDINMGCPVKKIVKGEAGAALMRDEDRAAAITAAVVHAADTTPVTVKMRLGWDDSQRNAASLARRVAGEGAVAITVHGRTRSQFYGGTADWRAIAEVCQSVSVPVIANGDIACGPDARTALDQSGAAGVMIGRATYGRPWLPAQIAAFLNTGQEPAAPGLEARRALMHEHFEAMLVHYGIHGGVRIARKHLSWASHGLPGSADFRFRVNRLTEPAAVRELIDQLYAPLLAQEAA